MFLRPFLEKPVFHFRASEASFIISPVAFLDPLLCQALSSTAPAHKIKPQGIRPMVAMIPTKWGQGVPFRPPLPRARGQDDVSSQANSLK